MINGNGAKSDLPEKHLIVSYWFPEKWLWGDHHSSFFNQLSLYRGDRLHGNVWSITTNIAAHELEDDLSRHLGKEDKLRVFDITAPESQSDRWKRLEEEIAAYPTMTAQDLAEIGSRWYSSLKEVQAVEAELVQRLESLLESGVEAVDNEFVQARIYPDDEEDNEKMMAFFEEVGLNYFGESFRIEVELSKYGLEVGYRLIYYSKEHYAQGSVKIADLDTPETYVQNLRDRVKASLTKG